MKEFTGLEELKRLIPEISVVMITAYGDIDIAVKALKAGASDFILKPWDNEKLLATLKLAIQLNLSKKEVQQLKERETELKKEINREQKFIIGSSPQLMKVLNLVRKVAKTDANVLITGENGTGKESDSTGDSPSFEQIRRGSCKCRYGFVN